MAKRRSSDSPLFGDDNVGRVCALLKCAGTTDMHDSSWNIRTESGRSEYSYRVTAAVRSELETLWAQMSETEQMAVRRTLREAHVD
jgi:hypothetical protein